MNGIAARPSVPEITAECTSPEVAMPRARARSPAPSACDTRAPMATDRPMLTEMIRKVSCDA